MAGELEIDRSEDRNGKVCPKKLQTPKKSVPINKRKELGTKGMSLCLQQEEGTGDKGNEFVPSTRGRSWGQRE